jgi:isopentenyl-diphosphate delta-isomerase
MTKAEHQHRKDEHLSLAHKYWLEKSTSRAFDAIRLLPNALPELELDAIDLSVDCLGQRFEKPFYIEAMTGGSEKGDAINRQLADIARNQHLAMAVGSQSIALRYPELAKGFQAVRMLNPDGFLFANIGAGHSVDEAKRAVEMIAADALELHVNVAQELAMREAEGDRAFYWLENIDKIATALDVPVIVKEVGFGMSQGTFKQLAQTAVSAINVGGSGGTNFAWIEHRRNPQGIDLTDFGLTTVEALLEAKFSGNEKPIIATGGIRNAQDIAKSLSLGACLASSAGAILHSLMTEGQEATEALLTQWTSDLEKICLLVGSQSPAELQKTEHLYGPDLLAFIQQRQKMSKF